jgi:hypothetical protein
MPYNYAQTICCSYKTIIMFIKRNLDVSIGIKNTSIAIFHNGPTFNNFLKTLP